MGGGIHWRSLGSAGGSRRWAGGEMEERRTLVGVVRIRLKGDIAGFVGGGHVSVLLTGRLDVHRR